MKPVTPKMLEAITSAKRFNNNLVRYSGGFWAGPNWSRRSNTRHYGASTINALVDRGLMEYTLHKRRADQTEFPIEATLTEKALI